MAPELQDWVPNSEDVDQEWDDENYDDEPELQNPKDSPAGKPGRHNAGCTRFYDTDDD